MNPLGLESAVAKAVNGRSEYQKPLLKRLDQMVARFDSMEDQIDQMKAREKRLAQYLDRAVNGVWRETDLDEARALLEEVSP